MEPTYQISFRTGYAKMDEPRPGFIRSTWYDDAGNIERQETNHYVCCGTTHCMFCGSKMSAT